MTSTKFQPQNTFAHRFVDCQAARSQLVGPWGQFHISDVAQKFILAVLDGQLVKAGENDRRDVPKGDVKK